jgi:hypothetical protein
MTLRDISIAWENIGLRRSDLHDALQAMVQRNHLIVQDDIINPSYVLTEHGAIRFYICLYCEASLRERLNTQREINGKNASRIVLGRVLNRRSKEFSNTPRH